MLTRFDFNNAERSVLNRVVELDAVDAVELGVMIANHGANYGAIVAEVTDAMFADRHNTGEEGRRKWNAVLKAMEVIHRDPDMEKMEAAFALVCPTLDGRHWKDPIDCIVEARLLRMAGVTIEDVKEAVVFYTGTVSEVTLTGSGNHNVTAAGYRMGPAGDR